jgi:hypothetical protein
MKKQRLFSVAVLTMLFALAPVWVVNDETVYDPEGNVLFKLIVVRILEKEDDTWKIVYISVVNTSSYDE